MSRADVMNVLDKVSDSVLDEVLNYALYLISKSDVTISQPDNRVSRKDIVKGLTGIISGYTGTTDDIRAERLGLVF